MSRLECGVNALRRASSTRSLPLFLIIRINGLSDTQKFFGPCYEKVSFLAFLFLERHEIGTVSDCCPASTIQLLILQWFLWQANLRIKRGDTVAAQEQKIDGNERHRYFNSDIRAPLIVAK